MLEKNQEYIGVVSSLGMKGEGVIKENGYVIFLPYALPGEKVRCKILKVKKNLAYAKLIEVIAPVDERVRPECKVFEKCGGCQLQHLKYSFQLTHKTEYVKDCFKKIAFIDINVPLTKKSEHCYSYRNKLQIPVSRIGNDTFIGFFAENSHRLIPVESCPIHPDWSTAIIQVFTKYIKEYKIQGYLEDDGSGELRHIVVRSVDGKLIITAVSTKDYLPGVDYLINLLKEKFYTFSLFLNVNKKQTNVIFGDELKLLYGEPRFIAEKNGIKYEMGVMSFMQVNDSVSSKIYDKAVKLAVGEDQNTVVIDAYSGAGLMTAMLAKAGKKAYGIEVVEEAVACANDLKIFNGLQDKMHNILGKCEDVLPDLIKKIKDDNETVSVVLDPPRKGCDFAVIDAVKKCGIDKVVYISCSPTTLARDVGLLTGTLVMKENGEVVKSASANFDYNISFIQPYDMFAQTKHVETLVCLTKTKNLHNMRLNPEPYEMMSKGEKTIELRLLDEKRQKIKEGDTIVFSNTADGDKLVRKVVKIHHFNNFEELYKTLPLLQCGYTKDNVEKASALDMAQFYSLEEQSKYGVIGIELALID